MRLIPRYIVISMAFNVVAALLREAAKSNIAYTTGGAKALIEIISRRAFLAVPLLSELSASR